VLRDQAYSILKNTFGYNAFRAGQEPVILALIGGINTLCVMPTGAGKSLCYQIPALVRGGLTIVVSPLVALMKEQVAALQLVGVSAETINSSRPYSCNAKSWRSVEAGQVQLFYISPERLMTPRMLNALKKLPVKMIVIDEAHCISRWGPAFRPDYEALSRLNDYFQNVPIAAMTATADTITREDIGNKLFRVKGKVFVTEFNRPNITLKVETRANGNAQLLAFLQKYQNKSGIVYCLSRKTTEETATFLQARGINAVPYHAGMDERARSANQDAFMIGEDVVIVATVAFGMGINKPDVRFVFHMNLPSTIESYYQEIGRAGRDGKPAFAHMLYDLNDIRIRRMFIERDNSPESHKLRESKRLDSLISYCESPSCRRQRLLKYFGEQSISCKNCDICAAPPDLRDGTDLASILIKTVRGTGEQFGTSHIIDILRGANTHRIRSFRHKNLSTFGSGKDIDKTTWRSLICQMMAEGLLNFNFKGHCTLTVTKTGAAVGRGEAAFHYRPSSPRRNTECRQEKIQSFSSDYLSGVDRELFNILKEHRAVLSQTKKVPAYLIFPDKTLIELARKRPTNQLEFKRIYGVGSVKLKRFAHSFLKVITDN